MLEFQNLKSAYEIDTNILIFSFKYNCNNYFVNFILFLNACDALYHSVVKRRLRQFRAPLCQAHIKRDWAFATAEVSADGRLVQRSFWRAFRRNADGDIDETLIPRSLVEWYADSDDEEDTVEEVEDDVEIT